VQRLPPSVAKLLFATVLRRLDQIGARSPNPDPKQKAQSVTGSTDDRSDQFIPISRWLHQRFILRVNTDGILKLQTHIVVLLGPTLILLLLWSVMQITDEVAWNLADFVVAWILLVGTRLAYGLADGQWGLTRLPSARCSPSESAEPVSRTLSLLAWRALFDYGARPRTDSRNPADDLANPDQLGCRRGMGTECVICRDVYRLGHNASTRVPPTPQNDEGATV